MTTLEAYYRLGDNPGSNSVTDSSGNGQTGSLLDGPWGAPTYGAPGVFLYDTDCGLDLTASTNLPNGGFTTNDSSTQPPTGHQPLGGSSSWSTEMWFCWTGGTANPTPATIPLPFTMPITHPTSFPAGGFFNPIPEGFPLASSYGTVGDLAILGSYVVSSTTTITSIEGTTSGDWTLNVRNQDAANGICMDIWTATVTAIGIADVLSISFSDTAPEGYVFVDSLTVGEGADTVWTFSDLAVNQSNSVTTTLHYPTLNADNSGNIQAYWGIGGSGGTISAVSTSGFASAQTAGCQIVYNLDTFPGNNPYSPVSTTASGVNTSAAIMIEASIPVAASVAAVPNATLMYVESPNPFEPFTAYELQLGFAETSNGLITNGVVEAFQNVDEFNAYQYPTNPFDGNWHYLVRCNNDPYPYLDNNPPTFYQVATAIGGNIENLIFGTAPGGVGLNPNETSSNLNTNSQAFTGLLDEVALYDGTLTAPQRLNHFDTALWFQQQEFGALNGSPAASRLGKVLAVMGLDPAVILRVPYPFGTLLYAETDTLVNTSPLNYAQTTSQTEPGIIFQGPDGYIYAYNREYQYLNPTSITSQALISDNSGSPYFYDGPSLQIAGDDVDLWNQVQVQSGVPATPTTEQIEIGILQNWGPPQSTALAQSAAIFGSRTLQGLTSLQMAHDSDALAIAQLLAATYYQPIERVTQLMLNSQGNLGANLVLMLQLGLMDRLTISYQGQTSGPPFTQDSIVEQIQHSVDMQFPQWNTTLAMSAYEILLPAFYLDSSTMDGPDVLVL